MLTKEQIEKLTEKFPQEALSEDMSRGFELTSIKAAFVFERLNQVFGPCGQGWRYVHSPFEQTDREVTTEVALQYRIGDKTDACGTSGLIWSGGWGHKHGLEEWSEPVFACGGNQVGKGSVPLTDARKSAVTDGLTKAASMLGIGHEVFKGQARAGGRPRQQPQRQQQQRPPATPAKVPIPYKKIQEAPFMTTYEECKKQFGEKPFFAYGGEVKANVVAAGYENDAHRKNLYRQLFGGDDPKEYALGFFRLLNMYALHLLPTLTQDSNGKVIPDEKEKEYAKKVVLYGVEHQADWFGAVEALEEGVAESSTEELPEDIPL